MAFGDRRQTQQATQLRQLDGGVAVARRIYGTTTVVPSPVATAVEAIAGDGGGLLSPPPALAVLPLPSTVAVLVSAQPRRLHRCGCRRRWRCCQSRWPRIPLPLPSTVAVLLEPLVAKALAAVAGDGGGVVAAVAHLLPKLLWPVMVAVLLSPTKTLAILPSPVAVAVLLVCGRRIRRRRPRCCRRAGGGGCCCRNSRRPRCRPGAGGGVVVAASSACLLSPSAVAVLLVPLVARALLPSPVAVAVPPAGAVGRILLCYRRHGRPPPGML